MLNQPNPKARGGYYTPTRIADFLATWAVEDGADRVLEPSAGDGALVAALMRASLIARIDAIELMEDEAAKISAFGSDRVEVRVGDAFGLFSNKMVAAYDAVVGNPPFIRYQNFPEPQREAGFAIMREVGLRPSRLTNAWVPFVVLATRALRPGGRLALVIPAEIMQVGYSAELREYLARSFKELSIVTFDKLVFPDIQQETVLLMGIRSSDGQSPSISLVELSDERELRTGLLSEGPRLDLELDHSREKWTQFYLDAYELGLVREIEAADTFVPLSQLASVSVGIVTGRNEFFVLRPSEARERGLEQYCLPLVGRSAQIPGLELSQSEWRQLYDDDSKCLLLQLGRTPRDELSNAARRYVDLGEERGFELGYKLRIRLPEWWFVPSHSVPDAFLLRQIYDAPRIVANTAAATSTDTIHRVRVRDGINPLWLSAASLNSLTFAFSEIRGRSYGGGVLELEPSEAAGLLIPRPGAALPLDELDHLVRHRRLTEALDEVDRLTLGAAGLTRSEVEALRAVWIRLSGRRLNRKSMAQKVAPIVG